MELVSYRTTPALWSFDGTFEGVRYSCEKDFGSYRESTYVDLGGKLYCAVPCALWAEGSPNWQAEMRDYLRRAREQELIPSTEDMEREASMQEALDGYIPRRSQREQCARCTPKNGICIECGMPA